MRRSPATGAVAGPTWCPADESAGVRAEVHEGWRAHGRAAGTDASRRARRRSRSRDRRLDRVRRELGVRQIQLSAALHPSQADVPPEAMLDPVANTLDLRSPFERVRARRVEPRARRQRRGSCRTSAISTTCCTAIPAVRAKKHEFMRARVRCGGSARCRRRLRVRRPEHGVTASTRTWSISKSTSCRCSRGEGRAA